MVQPHSKNGFLDVFREIVRDSGHILGGQTAQMHMLTMLVGELTISLQQKI